MFLTTTTKETWRLLLSVANNVAIYNPCFNRLSWSQFESHRLPDIYYVVSLGPSLRTPTWYQDTVHTPFLLHKFQFILHNRSSKRKISKWKLLNYIQSNEAISALEYKMCPKHIMAELNELKSPSRNERNFLRLFCILLFFFRTGYPPQSKHLCLHEQQNSCSQCLQLTHSILSSSLVVCRLFSQYSQHFVSESSDVSWLWISVFTDNFLCIFWPSRPHVLGAVDTFDFSALWIFRFCSVLLPSSVIKKGSFYFFNWMFSRYFGIGLIFKRLEEVVSSEEVSEGSIGPTVLNEGTAEIGNTLWELLPEVEGTQTTAIIRRCCSQRSYIFAGIRNGEHILRHCCGWNDKYPLIQKHLH